MDLGRSINTVQKQPPTPTIQPRSVVSGRYPCPTRVCQPRVNSLRTSRSMGALYMQRLRLQTLPSSKAGQQPMAANLRLTSTQQVLRAKAIQDGDSIGGPTPNPKGGLHVHLRPARRVLRAGHQPSTSYFHVMCLWRSLSYQKHPRLPTQNIRDRDYFTVKYADISTDKRGYQWGYLFPFYFLQNDATVLSKFTSRLGPRTP
jgi:hypothetical protein